MCGGSPCIKSVCGFSLQSTVIGIGIIELIITIIATILNIIKYASKTGAFDEDNSECEDRDVCWGPIAKYAVFDAFFGVICSFMLIFGAKTRNHCLLISWMVVTVIASLKYLYVMIWNDWTKLQDWIAITYLLFYTIVFIFVISLMQELKHSGMIHSPAPQAYVPTSTVVIQQTIPLNQPQPQYPQQGYYPPPQQPQQGYYPPPQQPPPAYTPQQPYNPGY